jgi:hypothetical protein
MDKYLVPTKLEDVEHIAPRLREADRRECLAATGKEPLDVLKMSLLIGDFTYTMTAPDGTKVGLFGVCKSPLEGAGVIWLCATDDIYQYQMTFLRRSKEFLENLLNDYVVLHNAVDARNTLHIKWLKWMGFTFIKKHEHWGYEQRPFYEFVRINNV